MSVSLMFHLVLISSLLRSFIFYAEHPHPPTQTFGILRQKYCDTSELSRVEVTVIQKRQNRIWIGWLVVTSGSNLSKRNFESLFVKSLWKLKSKKVAMHQCEDVVQLSSLSSSLGSDLSSHMQRQIGAENAKSQTVWGLKATHNCKCIWCFQRNSDAGHLVHFVVTSITWSIPGRLTYWPSVSKGILWLKLLILSALCTSSVPVFEVSRNVNLKQFHVAFLWHVYVHGSQSDRWEEANGLLLAGVLQGVFRVSRDTPPSYPNGSALLEIHTVELQKVWVTIALQQQISLAWLAHYSLFLTCFDLHICKQGANVCWIAISVNGWDFAPQHRKSISVVQS